MTTENKSTQTLKSPKWASEDNVELMQKRSQELAESTKTSGGPALNRIVGNIGASAQKKMASANDLMKGNVNSLLKGLDGKSPAGEKLLELRSTMDQLNPHSLHNAWWFSWMPNTIKRKAVSRFVRQYQPMQSHVEAIFDGLRNGKDDLLESNLALEQQYNEIAAAKKEIESEIYIGELFIQQVDAQDAETPAEDIQEKQKFATVKNQAMRRIRDLRTMEQASVQFFISIDQTIATNSLLDESIDSALTVGPMVMNNALRIQAALAQQETIKDAVQQFQAGLGDMMAQNAGSIEKAAQEVGDLYNNPVIALQKMEEGFDKLMNAVKIANDTMSTSTAKARETSDRLADMTAQLSPVADGMRDARSSSNDIKDVQDMGTDSTPKLDDASTPKIGGNDAK
ncbi:MAG: toxic anion resistance protein [Oleispira antarctica]|uniref:Toxic anion resistance family protein n=1 Tax=Oleispira antarctica RB-8 TaxID=698738 RepID=R4YM51_OLEAN|nr:toxic anion resistance protein [Oleispira antarctica]MBQ0792303.1 toxic anion resistance protein [Oleispira antarctica]CCK75775.1 Toxic anion resistance family protein [Oleispira antarctica RB-8]